MGVVVRVVVVVVVVVVVGVVVGVVVVIARGVLFRMLSYRAGGLRSPQYIDKEVSTGERCIDCHSCCFWFLDAARRPASLPGCGSP